MGLSVEGSLEELKESQGRELGRERKGRSQRDGKAAPESSEIKGREKEMKRGKKKKRKKIEKGEKMMEKEKGQWGEHQTFLR